MVNWNGCKNDEEGEWKWCLDVCTPTNSHQQWANKSDKSDKSDKNGKSEKSDKSDKSAKTHKDRRSHSCGQKDMCSDKMWDKVTKRNQHRLSPSLKEVKSDFVGKRKAFDGAGVCFSRELLKP